MVISMTSQLNPVRDYVGENFFGAMAREARDQFVGGGLKGFLQLAANVAVSVAPVPLLSYAGMMGRSASSLLALRSAGSESTFQDLQVRRVGLLRKAQFSLLVETIGRIVSTCLFRQHGPAIPSKIFAAISVVFLIVQQGRVLNASRPPAADDSSSVADDDVGEARQQHADVVRQQHSDLVGEPTRSPGFSYVPDRYLHD